MTGKYYLGLGEEKQVDFYIIKGVVEELLHYLGYENRYSFVVPTNIPKEFHIGQVTEIIVNGSSIGIVGKLHPNVTKDSVYVMEINLDKLFEKRVGSMKYKEISKFPSINKDMAFIVDKDMTSDTIMKEIKKSGGKLVTNIKVFDVYTGENVEEGKKSIAFNLTFEDNTKTLTDEEVLEVFNKIISEVEKKLSAKLRNM